ncbi:hypothetical protein [Actinoplanes regularis]|uniref:hypothetical protein n=1 Tax=Actinoplanes regularis TaxID=52697 RepID=UPI0024A0A756|nr:hypothetical protein [Actinoplanes regularis]GLW34751.1 hypothetical protein Areg01_76880 [Actinoplanes regularis]
MSHTPFIRCRAAIVALVAGLAAGALAIPVAETAAGTAQAAHATAFGTRVAHIGPSNAEPVKAVAVKCPEGTWPYAAGGAVNYEQAGNGGAALTAIVPGVEAGAVLVTAAAPQGLTANWSLVAFAVCSSNMQPVLVVGKGIGTARAACPGDQGLVGVGFHVAGDPTISHIAGVDINPHVTAVEVTAGGPGGAEAEVTALAVCRLGVVSSQLEHASNDGAGWPKFVSRQDDNEDLRPWATGAKVTGPAEATLDAIVPAGDDGVSWARGTLFGGYAPPAAFASEDEDDDDGDGSLTLETGLIGTFH